jgi:small-conductance mechanosensitive channel
LKPIRLFLASAMLCAALLCQALGGMAHAAEGGARETLDSVKSALNDIDDELKLDTLSDKDLVDLRARTDPLVGELQGVVSELTPRLDASRKRLAELKPKSQEGVAQPDPAAAELKAEQTKFDNLDAELRSARAALLQVDDYVARISAKRREVFTKQTFARSTSVLNPVLWLSVIRELPADSHAFQRLTADAAGRLAARATLSAVAGFLGVCLAVLLLAAPLRWVARRVLSSAAQEKAPGRLRKTLVAVWTLGVLAALPLLALAAVSYALEVFDLSDPHLQGVVDSVIRGLRGIALANAIARAVLSPRQPVWRLTPVGDEAAVRLTRLAVAVSVVWSISRLIEAIAESVLSYNVLVLTRGLAAIVIAALAADAFRKLARIADASAAKDAGRPVRTFVWIYLVAIIACAFSGYIMLATYLVEHALQFVGVIGTLYLADSLLQEACERLLRPDSTGAKSLMALMGLRRGGLEQIVVLVQGLARLVVIAAALAVAIGPFGMPSQDLTATLRNAYFGVSIGGVTLSVSSALAAIVAFALILGATRAGQTWLSDRYLPRTKLDAGVQNSIRTIFGYLGVVIALLAGSSRLGLDYERLTWIAGGLSVGIGFGLQGIANNFISGLILLWERGIRVGDWVVVGQDQGFVRSINARATEIETFERASLIVPNLTLVTGAVKNWMHNDRVGRIIIAITAAYESDPEAVRALLIDAAKAQDAVLSIPAPLALFSEFGDWGMKFQLIAYVEDALMGERVRSELNFDIMSRMRAAGLRIPYPFPIGAEDAARGPNTARLV